MSHRHQKILKTCSGALFSILYRLRQFFMNFREKYFKKFRKVVRHNSSTALIFWQILLKIKNSTQVMQENQISCNFKYGKCLKTSGGMSCNNAQLITQNVSEVVTHYTGYYTAKNRKKCLNYTKIHKFQGWFFDILWPKWLILKRS